VLTLCLPCAVLSWGQPTWQGLGFSGLFHEETHPCASNFIQSIFETVQAAGCINSVLVQTVPSVNDSIWEKYFLISVLNLGLQIFLLLFLLNPYHYHQAWIKPLCLFLFISSIKSHRFLLSSSIHKPNLKSLSAYGKDEKSSVILVNLCCTLSNSSLSLR